MKWAFFILCFRTRYRKDLKAVVPIEPRQGLPVLPPYLKPCKAMRKPLDSHRISEINFTEEFINEAFLINM